MTPGILAEDRSLTLNERRRGRRFYYTYSFMNSISWAVLAEGVVILLLLRLGGSATWVGAVSALQYITLPFMVVGYRTIARLGVTRTAGFYWGLRSCSAAFMILAPWVAAGWGKAWGLWFMFSGALGFMLGRAGGIVAFTGIITELTSARSRGELITNSSQISQVGSILMTCLMALFLGAAAPLYRYQIFLAIGLGCGLAAAAALWRIPAGGMFRHPLPFRLRDEIRWSAANTGRRWFLAMMIGIPMTQGITYAFGVLVAKQGYGLTDQQVVLLVLLATLGGIAASYTYGVFMDQIGSRPLLVLTGFLDMAGVLLVVLLPVRFNVWLVGGLFFINGYVHIAFNAAIQHYFISISNRTHQLAQGIVTRGLGGIAGGVALAGAGWLLETLDTVGTGAADPLRHFRWFYAGMLLLLTVRTLIFYKLPLLQSHGIRDALNALFSPWDWRAIHAVKRALTLQSEDEESRALTLLSRTGSTIFRDDLERYLRSPSLFVRQGALDALVNIRPAPALVQLLIMDMEVNLFTTAHRSAYLLGRWKEREAVPYLLAAVSSSDFRLCGQAIHALVEIGDTLALPQIEACFTVSENPYVLIQGARALSLWGDERHYRVLLQKYHLDIPPQTKDELSLSITRLMGLYDQFYRDLGMLRREPDQLASEWYERMAGHDANGLIPALRSDKLQRSLLQQSLQGQRAAFQSWFYEATEEFLGTRPEWVWRETAFLMTFLLLTRTGAHRWRSSHGRTLAG